MFELKNVLFLDLNSLVCCIFKAEWVIVDVYVAAFPPGYCLLYFLVIYPSAPRIPELGNDCYAREKFWLYNSLLIQDTVKYNGLMC